MKEGIRLLCKKKLGQFLLTEKPYCIINEVETKKLQWGQWNFIPLVPNMPYQIRIQFPYMGKACCPATINITLNPGEIVKYKYSVPFIVTSPGIIKELD